MREPGTAAVAEIAMVKRRNRTQIAISSPVSRGSFPTQFAP